MTSAVRDAANGAEFAATVRERYGLDGRTMSRRRGGAAHLPRRDGRARDAATPLLVIDIGGGSTELVVGARGEVDFHVSTQVGVVRHTERHLHTDPPTADELAALRADVRGRSSRPPCPPRCARGARGAVAVAGTATPCAAIDLELDPYDPARVEGHALTRARLEELLDRLAALPLAERRDVTGLDPARAPTIVAGIGRSSSRCSARSDSTRVEVSEQDILWGVALDSTFR